MASFRKSVFGRVLGKLAAAVLPAPALVSVAAVLRPGSPVRGLYQPALAVGSTSGPRPLDWVQGAVAQIFLRLEQEFPGQDELVVMVESGDPERNRQFIRAPGRACVARHLPVRRPLLQSTSPRSAARGCCWRPSPTWSKCVTRCAIICRSSAALPRRPIWIRSLARRTGSSGPPRRSPVAAPSPCSRRCRFWSAASARRGRAWSAPPAPPALDAQALFAGGTQAEQQMYITFEHGGVYVLSVRPVSDMVTVSH